MNDHQISPEPCVTITCIYTEGTITLFIVPTKQGKKQNKNQSVVKSRTHYTLLDTWLSHWFPIVNPFPASVTRL